jgi:hypothetical protein
MIFKRGRGADPWHLGLQAQRFRAARNPEVQVPLGILQRPHHALAVKLAVDDGFLPDRADDRDVFAGHVAGVDDLVADDLVPDDLGALGRALAGAAVGENVGAQLRRYLAQILRDGAVRLAFLVGKELDQFVGDVSSS